MVVDFPAPFGQMLHFDQRFSSFSNQWALGPLAVAYQKPPQSPNLRLRRLMLFLLWFLPGAGQEARNHRQAQAGLNGKWNLG